MRSRISRVVVGVGLALVAVLALALPAGAAWYSPVNTWEQSNPPAAPGGSGLTSCQIQSMDGNIFGAAFAKAQAVNSYCTGVTPQVVYGAGYSGTAGSTVGCCSSISQSTQGSASVLGGYFYVTTTDHVGTITVATTVFP